MAEGPGGPAGVVAPAAAPTAAASPAGAIPEPYASMVEASGAMPALWITSFVLANAFAFAWLVRAFFLYYPGHAARLRFLIRGTSHKNQHVVPTPGSGSHGAAKQAVPSSTAVSQGHGAAQQGSLPARPKPIDSAAVHPSPGHPNASNTLPPDARAADPEQPLDPVSELLVQDGAFGHGHGHGHHHHGPSEAGAPHKASRQHSVTTSCGAGGDVSRRTTAFSHAWAEDDSDSEAIPEVGGPRRPPPACLAD